MTYWSATRTRLAAAALMLCAACDRSPSELPYRLDVEQTSNLLDDSDTVTVLDVRTPEEFATGHIPGARNADIQDESFEDVVKGLDRNRAYVVHCHSGVPGGRAAKALARLRAMGLTQLHHLEGGIVAWTNAGRPVE